MKKKLLFLLIPILLIIIFIPKKQSVIEEEISEEQVSKIKVEIKGAVNSPGVYELVAESRVIDAIEMSGGLVDNADISTINLSKNLTDEVVIIIYTKEEIDEMKKGSTSIKYIDNVCVCPQIKNDGCIDEAISNIEIVDDDKISLNNASLEELQNIPGIGPSKAQAIIDYRANNPFTTIEDIMNVKGIGKLTFEKIKDKITI